MAYAYQRRILSGDAHGIGILITGTGSGDANTIHTALASTTEGTGDEVWLQADNPDTVPHTLKIWWGGTTAITNEKTFIVQALASEVPIIVGDTLRNALVIKASCDTGSKVSIRGQVNRITIA